MEAKLENFLNMKMKILLKFLLIFSGRCMLEMIYNSLKQMHLYLYSPENNI